jgi:hypothetical protein
MENYQYIVACGNVADGLTFSGPFIDEETASDWAERACNNVDSWHVITLETPT